MVMSLTDTEGNQHSFRFRFWVNNQSRWGGDSREHLARGHPPLPVLCSAHSPACSQRPLLTCFPHPTCAGCTCWRTQSKYRRSTRWWRAMCWSLPSCQTAPTPSAAARAQRTTSAASPRCAAPRTTPARGRARARSGRARAAAAPTPPSTSGPGRSRRRRRCVAACVCRGVGTGRPSAPRVTFSF